jgi:hypothetical protein
MRFVIVEIFQEYESEGKYTILAPIVINVTSRIYFYLFSNMVLVSFVKSSPNMTIKTI